MPFCAAICFDCNCATPCDFDHDFDCNCAMPCDFDHDFDPEDA